MDDRSAYAAELHAIAADLAKVPLGSRRPDDAYEAVDECRRNVLALASRIQLGAPARPANDRGQWTGPQVVVFGGHGVIECRTKRAPR